MARRPSISGRNWARPSFGGGDATGGWYPRSAATVRFGPARQRNARRNSVRSSRHRCKHRCRHLRSVPLRARSTLPGRGAPGNRLIHEFHNSSAISRRFCPRRIHDVGGRFVDGDRVEIPGKKETPEGTRSLDAPTNVNTGQITRCSCPFEQIERYEHPECRGQGTYPRLSSQMHRCENPCPQRFHAWPPHAR